MMGSSESGVKQGSHKHGYAGEGADSRGGRIDVGGAVSGALQGAS